MGYIDGFNYNIGSDELFLSRLIRYKNFNDKNNSEMYIPFPVKPLLYEQGQETTFEYLLRELDKGAEISDLVEDFNAKQKEDTEQL